MELLNCPFCNKKAVIKTHHDGSFDVGCDTDGCYLCEGADYFFDDEKAAEELWNTRTPDPLAEKVALTVNILRNWERSDIVSFANHLLGELYTSEPTGEITLPPDVQKVIEAATAWRTFTTEDNEHNLYSEIAHYLKSKVGQP